MASEDEFCDIGDGLRLCYRQAGEPDAPPVVLLAGLSYDLTNWPPALIDGLVAAGLRVVTVDNRDIGRSSRMPQRPPQPWRVFAAKPRRAAYDLSDMAADTVLLLDHLGIERAHLVGMSMGGMIAQVVAATRPDRVATLTSIFSSTGDRKVGQPARSTMLLLGKPAARTSQAYAEQYLTMIRHIASLSLPMDEDRERAWALGAWERADGKIAAGIGRQISAIQKSGNRTAQVRRISAPTLVINGDRDLMVNPTGGAATAAAIAGARHVVIPEMGHHFSPAVVEEIVELIVGHIRAHAGLETAR
ncbi:MAG: alpha/beta hydrolase [Tetrasphaera sp.]